jgi:hypothetical protein
MKALLASVIVPLCLIATASADWVLETKIESPQVNSAGVMKIKGDKLRVDMDAGPAGAVSSIIDSATGDTIQVLHSQKMAMKMSSAQIKQAMEAAGQMPKKDAPPVPAAKATGEKEKIGDYECEIYTWTDGPTSVRLWIAKGHPHAAALQAMDKKMRSGVLGAMQKGPDTSLLPGPSLKTETTIGGVKTTNTVISVKEQDLDAKDFEVPAGYKDMALPPGLGGK